MYQAGELDCITSDLQSICLLLRKIDYVDRNLVENVLQAQFAHSCIQMDRITRSFWMRLLE